MSFRGARVGKESKPTGGIAMGCQKGKPIRTAKPGDWRCKECGVVSAKKKKLCEPKKVKK